MTNKKKGKMSSSSSSSSSPSRSKLLELIGQKEVTRILILFLGLTASCLVLYKTAYPLQRLDVNNLSSLVASPSPPSPNSPEISPESAKPKISFKEILENASTKNNTVIITTLNQAWAEPNSLFDLFLESFHIGQGTQQLLTHVVVVCLDGKAFERCSQLHPNCYQIETSETDFSGEKVYNTPDYLKIMWRRIELLTQVLEMGFNFIFTDADIMWLRDPFPRLYPVIQMETFKWHVIDSSETLSIQIIGSMEASHTIKHMPYITEIGIQMRFFDTIYFGGFCQTSRDINLVCTMHANCCIGLQKKLHDLNLVLDDWRKYLSLSEHVQNTTWSAPMKCLED
ncbi:Nucleotide-diphospho-sugar transferase family protein [Raphanus sativus]|nr:Nucleotide-diphospho-sugar transferase family protein [Raphanus sativus]